MICPKCKKQKNEIVSSKFNEVINSLLRKRKCSCGHQFNTFELVPPDDSLLKLSGVNIKGIKYQKISNRTLWMDWRITLFGRHLSYDLFHEIALNMEKIGGIDNVDIKEVKKINKKIYFWLIKKNGETVKCQMKKKKIDIIKDIISLEGYWKGRNFYNKKKPVEDMNDEGKKYDEMHEYAKTIADSIKKEKYNQNFFIKRDPEYAKRWKDEKFWKIFNLIR